MCPTQIAEIQSAAARGFLRSLNILLKSARMYGMAHAQTVAQAADAWEHLRAVFLEGKRRGLQLAVSEQRLLVDGAAVKGGPAEQSFAQFLTSADLASVNFTPQVTQEAFLEMIRIFAESGAKPEGLAGRLKQALGPEAQCGIAIDEVRFVPAGSEKPEKTAAAQLLAETFSVNSEEMEGLLDDPLKLLELITASGGVNRASDSGSGGEENGGGSGQEAGSSTEAPGPTAPSEEDTDEVIRLLSRLAEESQGRGIDPVKLREELSRLPVSSRKTFQDAVSEFVESGQKRPMDTPLLLQVAEHLAVQLALDRYEKGDARVDAVAEMLNRLNREVETLRQALGSQEEKLKHAGFEVAPPADSLEQQFWSKAPEAAKLDVLLSDQAWRVPTQYIRQYLDQAGEQQNAERVQQVLENYVSCIHNTSPEARQKTAHGLKELAGYFPFPGGNALRVAIEHVGEELAKESDARLQKLITGTFVLLGQEAATRRRYSAVLSVMAALESLRQSQPELAEDLRARIGLENRVPNFLDEALHLPGSKAELVEVLRRMPLAAVEHLAGKISRRVRRREREKLMELAVELGPEAARCLGEAFRKRPPSAAALAVGLLSRLDPSTLEAVLMARLHEWNRVYQDMVVRNIAAAGAAGRAMLLAKLIDLLDPLVVPLAIDEIGMSGDALPAPLLLAIAAEKLPKFSVPYVRVKAIETLGRLKVAEAVPALRQLVESKESWHGSVARELRVVAAQSLLKIDPQGAKAVISSAGFKAGDLEPMPFDPDADSPGVRQRYYPRVKLRRALSAKISTADGDYSASIRQLSLGGGICACEHRLLPGTPAIMRIKIGLRSLSAKLLLRDGRSDLVAFEIVDMDLEDRAKLRTLLQGIRK